MNTQENNIVLPAGLVMRGRKDGSYDSKHGYTIKEVPGTYIDDEGKVHLIHNTVLTDYVLYDPEGKEIAKGDFVSDLARQFGFKYFSHQQRTGRNGQTDGDINYSPYHFPEGTVVETGVTARNEKFPQLTVDYITINNTGSYLLVFKEKEKELTILADYPGEMVNIRINMGHITKIVKRGTGKVVFKLQDHNDPDTSTNRMVYKDHLELDVLGITVPKLKKGEVISSHLPNIIQAYAVEQVKGNPEYSHRRFNELHEDRFIETATWCRPIINDNSDLPIIYAVNVKKLKKWLKKNVHRLYNTIKQDQKDNREEERRYMDDIYDFDD